MKKVIALSLSILTTCSLIPAQAKSPVCTIGKVSYASFQNALAKVKKNQTIILKSDITLKKPIILNKVFTLNGQNHTFNASFLTKGQLKIKDTSLKGSQIKVAKKGTLILDHSQVKNLLMNQGTMTLKQSTINTSKVENMKKMTITKSTINSNVYNYGSLLIYSGTIKNTVQNNAAKALLTIKDGTFKELSVYSGSVHISGGHFTGATSFYQQKGKVSGGSFNLDELTNYADGMSVTGSNLKSIIIQ